MPAGFKDSFSSGDFLTDPLQARQDFGQVFGAAFNQASEYTLGRQGFNRLQLETNSGGERISIEQANSEYGLDLKPTVATSISRDLAEHYRRRNFQKWLDESTLNYAQPNPLLSLGAGLTASLTDPVEFILGIALPFHKLTLAGNLAARAGRFVKPSVAARFFARNPSKSLLTNPFVAGVVEGGGSTALFSPMTYFNSQALGQEYTREDALMDIGASGLAGGALAFIPSAINSAFRRHGGSYPSGQFDPVIDPIRASQKAAADFAEGRPVDIYPSMDAETTLRELDEATIEVQKASVDAQRAADTAAQQVEEATQEAIEETVAPPSPNRDASTGDLVEPTPVKEEAPSPKKEAPTPKEDIPAPVKFESEMVNKHLPDLERQLLANPAEQNKIIKRHLEDIAAGIAKISDLMNVPRSKLAGNLDDATILKNEVIERIQQLNDILPADLEKLPVDLETTKKGILTKRAIKKIGKGVDRLNSFAMEEVDEFTKSRRLKKAHEALSKELHKANQNLKQAKTKGGTTVGKWQEKVDTLVPQLEQARRLLAALGHEIDTPELPLSVYVASLGDNVPPGLIKFLEEAPELGSEPVRRVRNKIFDNLNARLRQSRELVRGTHINDIRASKFPENDEILQKVRKYLGTEGDAATPERVNEIMTENLENMISEYKSIGIFDEKSLQRFDAIETQFKQEMEKVEAIRKGAIQAQACVLRGI